jgi:AAA+ superfamily predicted ATPase
MIHRYSLAIILFLSLYTVANRCASSSTDDNDDLTMLMTTHHVQLPSMPQAEQHIEELKRHHPHWADKFARKIHHLQNPDEYKPAKYPSRMLYYGPSGCGKTFTTLALAKKCNMDCLFIHGSSVETGYRRSGSNFLVSLFKTLLNHPERKFLVVFDEFEYLARFTEDERDTNQHSTVLAMAQCLDKIVSEQHICIIATDNIDPKQYDPHIQLCFFNNIFKFDHDYQEPLKSVFETEFAFRNNSTIDDAVIPIPMHSASKTPWAVTQDFEALDRNKRSISHLTEQEQCILAQAALEIAIHEKLKKNPSPDKRNITIKAKHYDEALKEHKKNFFQRVFTRPIVQQLTSVRALSYYLTAAGIGLRIWQPKYTRYGIGLQIAGQTVNAVNVTNTARERDMWLFSILNTLLDTYDEYRRYNATLEHQESLRELAAQRYEQSRIDRNAALELSNKRHEQHRLDITDDLTKEEAHYQQTQDDRTVALQREADRHQTARVNRTTDLERDEERHLQAQQDRIADRLRQMQQSKAMQTIALRGQYLKIFDILFNSLDHEIRLAQNIVDPTQRAQAVDEVWIKFEKTLLFELKNRRHEIISTFPRIFKGRVLDKYSIETLKQYYRNHGRSLPQEFDSYTKPERIFTSYE